MDRFPEDTGTLMELAGQEDLICDLGRLRADTGTHFVKTHEMPGGDDSPAVALIRDGRDVLVSYTHYFLKTERGIDQPTRGEFEATLEHMIVGENFGGWSANVAAWLDRVGPGAVIRYEDLIRDPETTATAVVHRLGAAGATLAAAHPSFRDLHSAIPWFFRKGRPGSWREEMPPRLQKLFLKKHGDVLLRLGYREEPSRITLPLPDARGFIIVPQPDNRVSVS